MAYFNEAYTKRIVEWHEKQKQKAELINLASQYSTDEKEIDEMVEALIKYRKTKKPNA